MKVGTDGVLLGAWANVNGANTILDIGTGSGVIALMIAQRTGPNVQIDAVEINDGAVMDASENFSISPWKEKVFLHHTTIQSFETKSKYDLIITNPPYFSNSFKPPDKNRQVARHAEDLKPDELLHSVCNLLSPTGRLAIILPPFEGAIFKSMALERNAFHSIRECVFRSREHKPVERLLMEFSFQTISTVNEELFLYRQGDELSESYRNLTKDFYLKV